MPIFSGVSFVVQDGELFVISGPNGVGKSTLLQAIAGFSDITTSGDVFDAQGSIAALSPDERFRRGIMLTFQEPPALPGVSFLTVAREMLFAKTGVRPDIAPLYQDIRAAFLRIGIDEAFIERALFDGFSGGEKKRAELALVFIAKPKVLLLDEIDAGLDVDGRRVAQEIIKDLLSAGTSIICVTHNPEFLASLPVQATYSLEKV